MREKRSYIRQYRYKTKPLVLPEFSVHSQSII